MGGSIYHLQLQFLQNLIQFSNKNLATLFKKDIKMLLLSVHNREDTYELSIPLLQDAKLYRQLLNASDVINLDAATYKVAWHKMQELYNQSKTLT